MSNAYPINIIIPAAGLGRRMKSFGPKSLLDIGDGLLIHRQIEVLHGVFPNATFIVVVGFESERVAKQLPHYVRVIENEHFEATNSARSVFLGLRASDSSLPSLVVGGDVIFNAEAVNQLPLDRSSVVVTADDAARTNEVGVNFQDGLVTSFTFGVPQKWGHIVFLHHRETSLFRRFASQKEKRRYYTYEILNDVIDHGGAFVPVRPAAMWLAEIDTSKDFESVRQNHPWRNEPAKAKMQLTR